MTADEQREAQLDVPEYPPCAECGHPFANHRSPWGTEMTCDVEDEGSAERAYLCGCPKYVPASAEEIQSAENSEVI